MLKEFKEFLDKFKVIPIAIALLLAAAFEPVVKAAADVLMQVVAKIFGSEDPAKAVEDLNVGGINYGLFLAELIGFIIIAFVIFMIIKALKKGGVDTGEDAGPTVDQQLLTEIRDALKAGR